MKPVEFILPFKLVMQPMKSLLLATFKNDPEFETLEPQVFDDPINGKGMRFLRHRRDGCVDVYWQPGVRVDRQIFGAGVGDYEETTIEPARLEIGERGVDCEVAFTDAQGRRVMLRVSEDVSGKSPFPLLAPVGGDIKDPLLLLLVYMTHFNFISRAGIVEGRIGERALQPDSIPLLLQGQRVWLARYASHPITQGIINPPMHEPVRVAISALDMDADGMQLKTDAQRRLIQLSAGHHLVSGLKQANIFSNGMGGIRIISSDHNRADASLACRSQGRSNFGPGRVDHADHSGKDQILFDGFSVQFVGHVGYHAVGQAQHAQRLAG